MTLDITTKGEAIELQITDTIYGEFTVSGVLEDLIKSKPIQRLKGIHQGGASYLVNENWNVTRYEHSVGVMLLIRKLGGSIEEQIAGLLHDVSHTAFSHVIDFVFNNLEESYHEDIFDEVIKQSEIPEILSKYSYDVKDFLDESRWTLLEQPAPELCADRVDYTLRDMYHYGYITIEEIDDFLNHLLVIDRKIYVQSIKYAEWFVSTYYKEVIDFFMDPLNIYGYDILAKAIRTSLEKGVLSLNDLLSTDDLVIEKLNAAKNEEIQKFMSKLHNKVVVEENKDHYDIHRKNKLRLIDPSVFHDNKLIKASLLSQKVKNMGEEAYRKSVKGVYVKALAT